MQNIIKPAVIVAFLALALAAVIFGVQRGIRYFLQAQSEPTSQSTPTAIPTVPFSAPSPTPFPTLPPLPTATPLPLVTPTPQYTLSDFKKFLNAMKTNDLQWDLNKDEVVDQADLDLFKKNYKY